MANSDLTIIVPTYGKPDLLYKCLQGISNEIVFVVDDHGPQEREIKKVCDKFRAHYSRNAANLGFLKTVNESVLKTTTKYVLLLNSDCIVPECSINHMIYCMEKYDAGVVGCRLLFPQSGRVQHAGVACAFEMPYHPFMYLHKDTPHVKRVMWVQAVTGAAMLIEREVWDHLDGFDEGYGLGVFEDVDFCWRAIKEGIGVLYDGQAYMYHLMHGSKHNHGYHHDLSDVNLKRLVETHHMESDEELFYGPVKSLED